MYHYSTPVTETHLYSKLFPGYFFFFIGELLRGALPYWQLDAKRPATSCLSPSRVNPEVQGLKVIIVSSAR